MTQTNKPKIRYASFEEASAASDAIFEQHGDNRRPYKKGKRWYLESKLWR